MNDRSDAALRERLELAKKATPEGENTLWMVDGAVRGDLCIREGFNFKRLLTMGDCTNRATARHIAANHPDVVCADLEEILALRAEVVRLQKKIEELEETAERDDLDGQIVLGEADKLAKALADNRICAHDVDDDGIVGAQEECARLNDCRECWRAYAHEKVIAEMESEEE